MRTAIVYKTSLLPYSETFIKEQILACKDWRIILLGRRRIPGIDLGPVDVRLLDKPGGGRLVRALSGLRMKAGLPGRRIISELREERPQLLHAHFGTEGVAAAPIARALGIPMVITLHGVDINTSRDYWESGGGGWWLRSYPRRLLALAQESDVRFVAVSDAIRRRAMEFGIPEEKVTTIYTGVDTRTFRPGGLPVGARSPKVLFIGRLVEKKGCDILIRAMATIAQRVVGATLTIVGDGPLRRPLEDLARQSGAPIEFAGALAPVAVLGHLHDSRVLCLPSVRASNGDAEGFGMVLLEAQAAGLPVVTSANGGAEEGLADHVSGFSFPPGDIGALAGFVTRLLLDGDLATSMGRAARTFAVDRFDILNCTAELSRFYAGTAQHRFAA